MIKVEHVTKRFASAVAVDDISFEVLRGEIVGFLGPNGAGKTTTLKLLIGLIFPTSGSARILGRSIDDCGLSVRSVNSLKNSGIRTVGDLVRCTQDQLLKVRNVGDKAVEEIADLLLRERLNFGMQWEDTDAGFRILDWGAAPVPPAVTSEAGKEE